MDLILIVPDRLSRAATSTGRMEALLRSKWIMSVSSWALVIETRPKRKTRIKLYRIGQRSKGKIPDLHRRDHRRLVTFPADGPLRLTQCFQVVEHDHRAFVEAEVLDREFDLSILDIKSAVAGEAGV